MKSLLNLILFLSVAIVATSSMAQTSTTGSIEGTITDPNGAAVRGATVTATSPNLITPKTVTSGEDGRYLLSALPPGTYKVTIEASGFAWYEKNDVTINLGRTSGIDAQLAIATATATVTVTVEATVDVTSNS